MKKKLLLPLFFFIPVIVNANINCSDSDSLKKEKWRSVFSLESRDSTEKPSKITIAAKENETPNENWTGENAVKTK